MTATETFCLKPEAMHLIAIFIAMILGVAVTAITSTLAPAAALSGFIKTGLGRRIAYLMVGAFGKSTRGLGYALTLSDTIIAPATPSNTARAGGILFPIVRSLSASMGSEPGPTANKLSAYLMFNSFQTTVITSTLFLTGVAPNAMIVGLAAKTWKYEITWMGWFVAAAVPAAICLLVLPYIIYKLSDPEIKKSPRRPSLRAGSWRRWAPCPPVSGGCWRSSCSFSVCGRRGSGPH